MPKILNCISSLQNDRLVDLLVSEVGESLEDIKEALSREREKNKRLKAEKLELEKSLSRVRMPLVSMLANEADQLEKSLKKALEENARLQEELLAVRREAEEKSLQTQQEFEIRKFEMSVEVEKLKKELASQQADFQQRNLKWSLKCEWLRKELLRLRSEGVLELHFEETARKQDLLKFDEEREKMKAEIANAYARLVDERAARKADLEYILATVTQTFLAMKAHAGFPREETDWRLSIEMLLAEMLSLFRRHEQEMKRETERSEWYKKSLDDLREWVEQLDPCESSAGLPQSPISTKFMVPMPICQICVQEFSENPDKTPRVLECGHTLCEECATGVAKSSEPLIIKCPFDRQEAQLKGGSVLGLPKNFTIVQMIRDNH